MFSEKYIPMLNGPGTNLFGQIEMKRADIMKVATRSSYDEDKGNAAPHIMVDTYGGHATFRHGDLTLYLEDYLNLQSNLAVGVHKLFDMLVIQLGQQNGRKCKNPNRAVELPLTDYMTMSSIPATKPSMDSARRLVKMYLNTLSHISLAWTETLRKKSFGYQRQLLFDDWGFDHGTIWAVFSAELAQYLTSHSFIMQYPAALLHLDDRKSTAYYLGKKLTYHYGLESNVYYKRNNRIKISSLLDAAPSLDAVRDPSHWKRNVRDTFENGLNTLVDAGIIDRWEYRQGKDQPISDISAAMSTFAKFTKLYIRFEIDDFPLPALKARKSNPAA